MRRFFAFLSALLLASPVFGQSQPSGYPLATLPLNGVDAVLIDQCASLGPPLTGCVTKYAPSTRVGQPAVDPVAPTNPFVFQIWWNTGVSPAQYSVWNGSVWVPVYQADQTTGLPSFPGNVYLPSGFLSISNVGATLPSVTPNWPSTLFISNLAGAAQGYTANAYENTTGTTGTAYRGYAARGPFDSPGTVQANDPLTGLHGSGFWSGKVNNFYISADQRAAIDLIATESWLGVNNTGTAIRFSATPAGSGTMAEIARFDGAGNIGFGTAAPQSGVTLSRNNIVALPVMGWTGNTYENGTGLVGNAYRGFSVRGTAASPTNLISGDTLASLQGGGFYTGKPDAFYNSPGDTKAQIGFFAGETWVGSTNTGTYITLSTTSNASGTPAERLRVFGSGGLGVGTVNDPGAANIDATGALGLGFSVFPTAQAGSLALAKVVDNAAAPGAGAVVIKARAGTNAGTCRLVAYAGTSATPVVLADNIGGAC